MESQAEEVAAAEEVEETEMVQAGSEEVEEVGETELALSAGDSEPAWLESANANVVVQRLKVVKTAWLSGGGTNEKWFSQNGCKRDRWNRISEGLRRFQAQGVTLPPGLKEAVLAESFEFEACMKRFGLDWDSECKKHNQKRPVVKPGADAPQLDGLEESAPKLRKIAAGGKAAAPHPDQDVEFPVACSLTKDERGVYTLSGACRICGDTFRAIGSVSSGKVLPFNTHAGTQTQMAAHAKECHGMAGWTCHRKLDEEDPSQRLRWTKGDSLDEERAVPVRSRGSSVGQAVERVGRSSAQSTRPPPKPSVTTSVRRSDKVAGARPTVVIANGAESLPEGLLPEDAKVSRPPCRKAPRLEARTFADTLAEVAAAGVEAPPSWRGLGVVPQELRSGFKSLLVLGPSGSGKTTLLRALLSECFPQFATCPYPGGDWQAGRPLIEAFETADAGRDLLGGVGLGSVPSWCKPFEVLSVGEKYRANVALALQARKADPQRPLVFDEWTSELDRDLARVLSLALGKRLRKGSGSPGEGGETEGPYIFATCHDDVAQHLQPEWLCYCKVDEPPVLVLNQHAGAAPKLRAMLRGSPDAPPVRGGSDFLVGCWADEPGGKFEAGEEGAQDRIVFSIRPRPTNERGVFQMHLNSAAFAGICTVQWLRQEVEAEADVPQVAGCFPGPWYLGENNQRTLRVRLRLLGPTAVGCQYQLMNAGSDAWEMVEMQRHVGPSSVQALLLTRDPCEIQRALQREGRCLNYLDFDLNILRSNGWYLPPEFANDGLYGGLIRDGEAVRVSASDFCLNPRSEQVEDEPYYLATYVGEKDGYLCDKLEEVSKLLDCPFDGLCVHKVSKLQHLGDFSVGVVTGPSGSGKSSLVNKMFVPSPVVEWSESIPVVGHFSSLARAREFCGAACLDLSIAMRPYCMLSSGEQARAQVARLLDAAAQDVENGGSSAAPRSEKRPLLLEEFTSLVDRAVAKRMAVSVRALVAARQLKVVAVSCHSDFVGALRPDWLFECNTSRLLRFEDQRRSRLKAAWAAAAQAADVLHNLQQQLAALASPSPESALLLHGFFSAPFRAGAAELAERLRALGVPVLEARGAELRVLEREALEPYVGPTLAEEETTTPQAETESVPKNGVPLVQMEVRRALPREWEHFREHHYKDHSLKGDSVVFVGLVGGRAACFTALVQEPLHFVRRFLSSGNWPLDLGYPEPWLSGRHRILYREHRSVVLPDFQGMGLGPLLCDAVACYILAQGNDFTSQTVHPFYGSYRDRSPFWRPLPSNRSLGSAINGNLKYSHIFVGATLPDGSVDPQLQQLLEARAQLEGGTLGEALPGDSRDESGVDAW
ncbi:unnamed protein product [Polarella glacialis]|uniref:AAA+ ATPase domain-containing protein n=2 Tax=Polarella glacialis TaxID=89957 RepID=A0A813K1A6_POLGL|nr:unnamed protein product [Polarella glacialis]